MRVKINSMPSYIIFVVALSIFAFGFSSSKVLADGNETLGVPSIPIEPGTGIIAAGVGLAQGQPGTINIDVPPGAAIKQVLLYWNGIFNTSNPFDDDQILVGIAATPVTGIKIGESYVPTYDITSVTYRADITILGLVSPGSNSILVGGLAFHVSNGAGILVIFDDGSGIAKIDIRDGNDFAYHAVSEPFKTTNLQTFTFPSSDIPRTATLAMFFASVSGTASNGGFRPSAIEVTIDGLTTVFNNKLDSHDGEEWDTLNWDDVFIPAGATSLTVQAFSVDNEGLDGDPDPASFTWLTAGLSIENEGEGEGEGEGCTPGYWRQEQHFDSWTEDPETLFSDAFGCGITLISKNGKNCTIDNPSTPTLLDALKACGNDEDANGCQINAFARHAVAALLNASASINYPLSVNEVKALVCAALPADCSAIAEVKDILATLNESGCPLD